MKHFILSTLLASAAAMYAAPTPQSFALLRQTPHPIVNGTETSRALFNSDNAAIQAQQARSLSRASDEMAEVGFTLANKDNYTIRAAVALEPHTGTCVYFMERDKIFEPAQIPAGTYHFLFWGEREDTDYWYQCMLSETVNITDGMTYDIDFTKCTDFVKFESTLPDGERAQLPLINLDTDETIEPGNIANGLLDFYLFMDNVLIDWTYTNMDKGMYDDGWKFDMEECMNVYVNPEASNLAVVQYRGLIGDEEHKGAYYSACVANPLKAGVYKSQPYALHHAPINISNNVDPDFKNRPVVYYSTYYFGQRISMMAFSNQIIEWPLGEDWYVGSNDATDGLGLDFYPQPAAMYGIGNCFTSTTDDALGVICNPIKNDDGTAISIATASTFDSLRTLANYNAYGNWKGYPVWSENEWFNIKEGQTDIENCNSAPIFVSEHLWYPKAYAQQFGIRSILLHNYKGRNGESRTIDFLGEEVKVEINGQPLNMASFPSIHTLTIDPDTRYGVWDVEFVNNNVFVNGEKGSTKAHIHFDDNLDDVNAPTLQMLQTRNSEGIITDTFRSTEDGNFVLAGGDFSPLYASETQKEWFKCVPCDIKLEAAPIGTEEWEEIELTENKDRFLEPGWGCYWEGNCSNLNKRDQPTTYSLRITLTDEAGNYQQQTLYPVFTILFDNSGVETIEGEAANSTYYNLQGIRIDAPSPGSIYIEKRADGKAILKVE